MEKEELKDLYDSFPGDINEKVTNYETDKYKNNGIRCVDWGTDAEGKIREINLHKGKIISRYKSNDARTGHYFCEHDENFELLQLPYSEDKYEKCNYIVLKEFPVLKSKIAVQSWNCESNKKRGSQYYSKLNENDLLNFGYIKLINKDRGIKE